MVPEKRWILNFHDETAVNRLNDDGDVEKKTGAELIHFDVDNPSTLSKKRKIIIGEEATKFIRDLSLEPKSAQLSKFYEKVVHFYRTVVLKYQHYFNIGLNSTELEYLCAFNPKNCNSVSTSHMMKYLSKRFSKIVKNIEPTEGQDRLLEEIDEFVTDKELKEFNNSDFEEFWLAVLELREGGWIKYPILPWFALAFGTLFNSNSETERAFSVQTDIHRDLKRNLMIQETFDAHMQIHFGVEGEDVRKKCKLCREAKLKSTKEKEIKPFHHCHCSLAPIDKNMIDKCRKMWNANQTRIAELNSTMDLGKEEKEKAALDSFATRKLKFVTQLKTRGTFSSTSQMSPIFINAEVMMDDDDNEDKNVKEKAAVGKQATSKSSNNDKQNKKRKRDTDNDEVVRKKIVRKDVAKDSSKLLRKNSSKLVTKDASKDASKLVTKDVPITIFKKK